MPTTGQVFKNRKELAILIKMPTTGQVFKNQVELAGLVVQSVMSAMY